MFCPLGDSLDEVHDRANGAIPSGDDDKQVWHVLEDFEF